MHPTDADWQIYLDALRDNAERLATQLIVTDGGSPNSAQRRASIAIAEGRPLPPTAVVTSSVLARGAVAALSWFMKDKIRAFPPADFEKACAFIGAAEHSAALRLTVDRLRSTVH
jgi:DNA-binding LacI/PurR family transcriptional regulator